MADETDARYFTDRAKASRTAADNADVGDSTEIHTALAVAYDGLAKKAAPPVVCDTPSEIKAVNGEVHMEGSEHETIAFTPSAAERTADSLARGAREAAHQNSGTRSPGA